MTFPSLCRPAGEGALAPRAAEHLRAFAGTKGTACLEKGPEGPWQPTRSVIGRRRGRLDPNRVSLAEEDAARAGRGPSSWTRGSVPPRSSGTHASPHDPRPHSGYEQGDGRLPLPRQKSLWRRLISSGTKVELHLTAAPHRPNPVPRICRPTTSAHEVTSAWTTAVHPPATRRRAAGAGSSRRRPRISASAPVTPRACVCRGVHGGPCASSHTRPLRPLRE